MPANMPKRYKFRKQHRKIRNIRLKARRGNSVSYGDYGLQALDGCWLSARQIEAGRMAAQQYIGKEGKVYIRVFPATPVTKKPLEVRMGSGKGDVDHWAAEVRPGTILYEVGGVNREAVKVALARVASKMPVRCRMVERQVSV